MRAGDIVADRFEIEGHATSGGMAQIFRARDRLTGEPVALKLLQRTGPQESHRFRREAHALAALRHPGVVGYVAHGTTEGGDLYLAMQWLSGETLAERLLREPLTVPESLSLGVRVASTLGALHRLGVVHRDLKPSNLLLVGGSVDEVTLLDFGVVRVADAGQELTMPGVMLGTPGYMAPEQARGEVAIDARADVFALGCILYRCLTGRPPFVGNDGLSVLVKVLLEDPPRLRELRGEVPAALDDLVTRMLAKAPRDRPRDGAAVAAELGALGDLAPGSRRGVPLSIGGPTPELTTGERRMICLLVARDGALDSDATRSEGEDALRVRALSALAERHQGRLEIIEARSPVVVLSGLVAPTDLAARGARCALAMQVLLGGAPVALVSGRAEITARSPIGKLIDQAAALLAGDEARLGVVRIDDVTASLLGARFDLGSDHAGHLLRGECDDLEAVPRLLGKPTPCVGRDRELSLLEATFVQCIEEQTPSAVLVTAPAGMGKSRLRVELLRRLRARDEPMAVWIARGDPMSAGSAFGLLAQVLRRALGVADGAPAAAVHRKIRERVGRHGERVAHVAPFLGELVGTPFPDEASEALRAARRSSVLMGDQLHLAWEEFLRAECAAQPVLLVLEDMHWGDLPTVGMINSALRNLRDAPFMVLALGRPEVREMFPKLWAGRGLQEIELAGLSRRASERLARQALGGAVTDEMIGTLVERADGNAFFLEEQIRAAAEGRGAALPETVLAMVQARLEALAPEARRVLRAASVFGQSFRPAGVAALLGGADAEVADWLAELVEREVIVQRRQPGRGGAHGEGFSSTPSARGGPERDASPARRAAALDPGPPIEARADDPEYSFRHGLVREAAYGALTEYDRRLGHRLVAEWLEGEGKGDAAELAEHFERGAEPGRAAAWYRRAAEQALRGNDLLAAIRHAERGLACGATGAEAGGLLLVDAEARVWRGDFAVAEQRALEAVALFEPGSPSWYSAVTWVVMAAGKQGAFDRVESWVATARGASPREGALTGRDVCLVEGANWLAFGGRYAVADGIIEALERSGEEERPLDVEVLARLYEARAIRTMTSGDLGACLDGIEAALAVFERSGDRRNACSLRVNLGAITMELGDYEGAEAALRAALRAAEQMELTDLAAFARSNLGNVMIARGNLDEARRVEEEAIATFQRLGDPRAEGIARAYLGKAALLAGDLGAAEAEARAAAELLQNAPPLRAAAWALSARVLLRKGCPEEALALSGDALSLLESLGAVEEGESLIRLVRAEALFASGRQDEALAAIAQARHSVMSRAGQISNPRYRDQFLSALDNGETLALAAQWLGDRDAP
ncbi:protein kinase domain-containing protein [Sorangium atrum]|uniref:Protein kinase n=1 Tax=Sorangium atrum TaxID=2995308 RepID=A0ABT5CBJ1_9BACT|nr:protein kinase [Sorangium aterium]MDC0683159.1 protein kinase [Sorangium aterium]